MQMYEAIRHGDMESLLSALADGIPVDCRDKYNKTPLMIACTHARPEMVKFFLERGYVHTHTHMHIHTHAHPYTYTHTHTHTICTLMHRIHVHVHVHAHTYTCIHTYTCTHKREDGQVHVPWESLIGVSCSHLSLVTAS